jgi:flagellar hook protein FlgE
MIDFNTQLSGNALTGMTRAETSVNQIAARVAQPASDTVDLSTDMVSLLSAKNNFAADAKLAQTEDQMTQSMLSILA